MAEPIVKVLDTTVADNGNTQTVPHTFLKKDIPLRFTASIGSGDTVVIETKSLAANDFEVIHSFTDDTPKDIYPGTIWRARRSVDGGSADSTIWVENTHNIDLTEHS
jgi:hypothetical protein